MKILVSIAPDVNEDITVIAEAPPRDVDTSSRSDVVAARSAEQRLIAHMLSFIAMSLYDTSPDPAVEADVQAAGARFSFRPVAIRAGGEPA